jgi:acetolactate synthase-1/2/3 large subunit
MRVTTGQILARCLKQYGVPLVAGIPGHGNWSMLDALNDQGCDVPFIQVFHEQSAIHLADAYYRATGVPCAASTSIGPGAMNTVIGLATAYADSTAVLLLTGSAATHMRGHGVMQELDRYGLNDFSDVAAPVTKRRYQVVRADEIPFVMHRAFNAMLSGRPGPVHVELPLDVQIDMVDGEVAPLAQRLPVGRPRPDAHAVEQAIELLLSAERPVIVAGGGTIAADASSELVRLATDLGIPVVTTWNGKGAIPEDHDRNGWTAGWPGSISGNTLAANADVVLSLGCKFTDWSASSYRKGVTFSLPPGKLIQVDLDSYEIGKNYPAEVGVVGVIRSTLSDILAGVSPAQSAAALDRRESYLAEVADLKDQWENRLAEKRSSNASPMTMLRVLAELRAVLPRNGIVTVGSGHPQSATKQSFPIYEPRTHITSGSYSPMGFAVPAAIGAKFAKPDSPVVCIVGDGDFMQTMQELAVCVMHNLPVVFLVLNNKGYISIRDGQIGLMTRQIGGEFNHLNGEPYSPDFAQMAKSFGFEYSISVDRPDELARALKAALECGGPAMVEAQITRDRIGAPEVVGWWDFPLLPTAPEGMLEGYARAVADEQHR